MHRKNDRDASNQSIMATILQKIPPGSQITKIEYEGPRIAIYTTSPKFLLGKNKILSDLVSAIKKRIVIRTDQSIRKPEADAKKMLAGPGPKGCQAAGDLL